MIMFKHAGERLAAAALVCMIFGFCFILVGTFGPAWLVFEDSHQRLSIEEGIWLAKYCINMTCIVSSREHILADIGHNKYVSILEGQHWLELKVLSVLAITISLVAISTTTIVLVTKSRNHLTFTLTVGGVCSLSSCILLLIPVLKTSAASSNTRFTMAWTRLVASVGVFLHFVATILEVLAIYQNMQHRCALKHVQRLRRRRDEMVVRYLCTHSNVCDSRVTNYQLPEPGFVTANELTTIHSDSGLSCSALRGPPPFTIASKLPSYSEITVQEFKHCKL